MNVSKTMIVGICSTNSLKIDLFVNDFSGMKCIRSACTAVLYTKTEAVCTTKLKAVIGNAFSDTFYVANERDLSLSVTDFASKFWGQYFFISVTQDCVEVLRSPDGLSPLFYGTAEDGAIIFSTDMRQLIKIIKPKFNWNYMLSFLMIGTSPKEISAFEGINELPFGSCLHFEKGNALSFSAKNLGTVCRRKPSGNLKQLTESIAETLINVISCELIAYKHKKVFVDFSGGLDSSAVLFCLREVLGRQSEIYAVNVYSKNVASSNELEHAKKIANACDVELIIFEGSSNLPFAPFQELRNMPFAPDSGFMRLNCEENICKVAGITDDDIVFTGQGGDHVFMCPPPLENLVDVFATGNLFLFIKKLEESCVMRRISVFKMLKVFYTCLLKYLQGGHYTDICQLNFRKPEWLVCNVLHDVCKAQYPFYQEKGIIPGKYYQADSINVGLAEMCSDIRAYGVLHRKQLAHPLFSQPIIDLGLMIPTYEMYNERYDRLLYRQSISDRFETQHVWRRDKGDVTGTLLYGLAAHKTHVIETCLEGKFAENGFLNKDLLCSKIKNAAYGLSGDFDLYSIVNLYCAESFMKCWDSR